MRKGAKKSFLNDRKRQDQTFKTSFVSTESSRTNPIQNNLSFIQSYKYKLKHFYQPIFDHSYLFLYVWPSYSYKKNIYLI